MSTDGTNIAETAGAPAVAQRPRIALRPHAALPWLVLPEGLPLQMLMDVVPVRVPNTRTWFHGVLSQRGNLMPVFDLGHWAGLEPIARQQAHLVSVGQGAHAYALLCVATPSLIITSGDLAYEPDTGALAPYLGAASVSTYGPVYEFDAHRWLASATQQVASSGALTVAH
jgi:CheW-like domain